MSLLLGEAHSIKVEEILFKERSEYQEVLVFKVEHLYYKLLFINLWILAFFGGVLI